MFYFFYKLNQSYTSLILDTYNVTSNKEQREYIVVWTRKSGYLDAISPYKNIKEMKQAYMWCLANVKHCPACRPLISHILLFVLCFLLNALF